MFLSSSGIVRKGDPEKVLKSQKQPYIDKLCVYVKLDSYNNLTLQRTTKNSLSRAGFELASLRFLPIDLSGNYVTTNTVFNLGPP